MNLFKYVNFDADLRMETIDYTQISKLLEAFLSDGKIAVNDVGSDPTLNKGLIYVEGGDESGDYVGEGVTEDIAQFFAMSPAVVADTLNRMKFCERLIKDSLSLVRCEFKIKYGNAIHDCDTAGRRDYDLCSCCYYRGRLIKALKEVSV